jgi:hypothetical protein
MLKSYIYSQQLLLEAKLIPDTGINFFIHYLEDNGYPPKTTPQYMETNLEMKRKALAMLPSIDSRALTSLHRPSEDVLAFLESL